MARAPAPSCGLAVPPPLSDLCRLCENQTACETTRAQYASAALMQKLLRGDQLLSVVQSPTQKHASSSYGR